MKTIIAKNIRRNRKHLRQLAPCACALVLALTAVSFVNSAHAQKNPPMMAVRDVDDDELNEAFQNVKEVHLYVCDYRSGEGLPDLLKPNALAQEELKYIKTLIDSDERSIKITFADGKKHEPLVTTEQPCEALYDPVMETPGNLSFILKVFPVLASKYPGEIPHSFAALTRLLYRPDHKQSIAPMLRAKPFYIWNLNEDEVALRKEVIGSTDWVDNYGVFEKPPKPHRGKVFK
jgi:hypothetical protein